MAVTTSASLGSLVTGERPRKRGFKLKLGGTIMTRGGKKKGKKKNTRGGKRRK